MGTSRVGFGATWNLNVVELERQVRQVQIDGRKSAKERNVVGQFATPYDLALDITKTVFSLLPASIAEQVHFGEPSCGSGAFFSALLHVFTRGRIASATGIEIDPLFVNAAKKLWCQHGLDVVEGDFTHPETLRYAKKPNLILANPPYVRHHHIQGQKKAELNARVTSRTGIKVSGLAGLYVYFMLLAHDWMQDGAYAAWLIPSEFMDVNYGVALKRYLTEFVTLQRIHRFDPADVQFDDALVSSAVVIFHKTRPVPSSGVSVTFGGSVGLPSIMQNLTVGELRNIRKWSSLPTRDGSVIRRHGENREIVLGDLFKISRGIATGSNKFFILSRVEAERLGLPAVALRPILPSPRFLKDTVIDSDTDGFPVIDPQLVLLDTDLPVDHIASRYPELNAYLASGADSGVRGSYLVNGRKLWYRQEQRARAPFLITYMGRGKSDNQPFRFVWNRSAATATNVYLMLYPKAQLARILERNPNAEREVFELLNELAPHDFRDEGRTYGGGLHKIEPTELAQIPARKFVEKFPGIEISQTALSLEF